MGWSLGMIMAQNEREKAAEGKTGMAYVEARLRALNHLYCWCSDTKETKWPMVNRHLWRIHAMYEGGDCFLAGWKGAVPHQKLWPTGTLSQRHALPAYRVPLKNEKES